MGGFFVKKERKKERKKIKKDKKEKKRKEKRPKKKTLTRRSIIIRPLTVEIACLAC
jgi:hypothetical protein